MQKTNYFKILQQYLLLETSKNSDLLPLDTNYFVFCVVYSFQQVFVDFISQFYFRQTLHLVDCLLHFISYYFHLFAHAIHVVVSHLLGITTLMLHLSNQQVADIGWYCSGMIFFISLLVLVRVVNLHVLQSDYILDCSVLPLRFIYILANEEYY